MLLSTGRTFRDSGNSDAYKPLAGDFDVDGRCDVAAIVRSGDTGVDARVLQSTRSSLRLSAAQGAWPGHDHFQTRTLNVVG